MNEVKMNSFLETLTQEEKDIVKLIVSNTIHIDQDYMLELLHSALDEFELICPEYNLYIPKDKIGSEHWLLVLLQERLKPTKVFYGKTPDDDLPVLILDDAIYSSHNMCSSIDDITYVSLDEERLERKFYCVVAVTSGLAPSVVTDFGAVIIAGINLEHLQIRKLIPNYDFEKMRMMLGCETDFVIPVYFDHKIANKFGSYQFYHKIISEPVDRSPVDAITEEIIEDLIKRWDK